MGILLLNKYVNLLSGVLFVKPKNKERRKIIKSKYSKVFCINICKNNNDICDIIILLFVLYIQLLIKIYFSL